MLVIDAHAHLGRSKLSSVDISETDLINSMERWGVDAALVIPHAVPEEPFLAHKRVVILTRRYPGRFYGIAAYNPLQMEEHYGLGNEEVY